MTKRIFRSICLVALIVFMASAILFLYALYGYFSGTQRSQLRAQTELAARAAANEGLAFFDGMEAEEYRITWIDADGTVLYDSRSDSGEMENHLEREEIQQALSEGFGESTRYSTTLMEQSVSIYCARRLPDGTVLRLSVARYTMPGILLRMVQPLCIIFAIAVVLSFALAFRLSGQIVRPLNELDLDAPAESEGYEEIAPLLRRISLQQRRIRTQEEELRQKREEFDVVAAGMPEGIVLLNKKKIILSINPAAARLFEADASCVGKYILSLNRDLELQGLLQKAGDGKCAEMTLGLANGRYQLNASPVFSQGMVSGIVLLLLDVTEREKAEQLRREFTANVSHELKTPLHTILGSSELLVNGMVAQKDIPEFSRRIYVETQRMIRLVEDILRLSRLDEGAYDGKREEVDLYALARETVGSLLPKAEDAGVEMTLTGETAMVYGIRQPLQGILYNLCDNAIQYNRRGGSVTVRVEDGAEGVCLSVADTGIGIPAEHQGRIFERFYRVDKSHSREMGGTGLGLAIVKHAARLHNAVIELQSAVGSGTAIAVRFPKDQAGLTGQET